MKKTLFSKTFSGLLGLYLLFAFSFTTGCASGGYYLTRSYSGWVNRMHVVPRVLVYLFTGIIYFFTIIIDLVAFNTMDFWEGKVSAGSYQFEKDGVQYAVTHSFQEENPNLKQTQIQIQQPNKPLQIVLIKQLPKNHHIMLSIDGVEKVEVENIYSLLM